MPPDGYEAVTLPEELVSDLDDHARAIGSESRADAIRSLFDGYDSRVSARVDELDSGVVDDIAARTSSAVVRDLEELLR